MTGGGDARRQVDGRTEVVVTAFLGLTGVQTDPEPDLGAFGPGLAADRALQRDRPGHGVAGPMEGDTERVAAGREGVAGGIRRGRPDELVVAGDGPGRLLSTTGPETSRPLDVGEPERHRPGRNARRGPGRWCSDAQPLVLVEDQRLQLPQARPRFDPELFDEVF